MSGTARIEQLLLEVATQGSGVARTEQLLLEVSATRAANTPVRVHAVAAQVMMKMPGAPTRVHTVAAQVMAKTPGAMTRVHALAVQVLHSTADAPAGAGDTGQAFAVSSDWGPA